jgi:hypothetical protein
MFNSHSGVTRNSYVHDEFLSNNRSDMNLTEIEPNTQGRH